MKVTTRLTSRSATHSGGAFYGHPDRPRQRTGVAATARVSDAIFELPERVPARLYELVAQRLPLPSPPTILIFLEIPDIGNCNHVAGRASCVSYSSARCFASTAAGALHTSLNVQRSGASAHARAILS